jgi:hypothetical protein
LLDCIEIREYSVTIKDDCWKDCDVIMRLIQEYTGYSVNEIYHQCCDNGPYIRITVFPTKIYEETSGVDNVPDADSMILVFPHRCQLLSRSTLA